MGAQYLIYGARHPKKPMRGTMDMYMGAVQGWFGLVWSGVFLCLCSEPESLPQVGWSQFMEDIHLRMRLLFVFLFHSPLSPVVPELKPFLSKSCLQALSYLHPAWHLERKVRGQSSCFWGFSFGASQVDKFHKLSPSWSTGYSSQWIYGSGQGLFGALHGIVSHSRGFMEQHWALREEQTPLLQKA